jgi:predicted histidine transporter YuiF (NhaC family)
MTNRRKHRSQMTPAEIALVERAIHSKKNWNVCEHVNERMAQKNVTRNEMLAALEFGQVIEVHNNVKHDVRALVRHTSGNSHVCVVVSLITGLIITTYRNDSNDGHSTLNTSMYAWKINLMNALRAA